MVGARIWSFDIKPIDDATIFAYLGKGGKFQIDYWVKLKEKDEKLSGGAGNWTLIYGMGVLSAK